MLPALLLITAYFLGSIPFSYLVVRIVAGADIRQHGSRNVGATNVARTFGKMPGIIALLLDIAKGYAAVVIAQLIVARHDWPLPNSPNSPLHSHAFWIGLAALVAMLGHMFPLWLKFHGGKGVATATGAFLAISPIAVAGGVIVFIIVILATRFVSLASILSAASIPIFFRYLAHASQWTIIFSVIIAVLIAVKHHSNVERLVRGTERRLGERKDSQ